MPMTFPTEACSGRHTHWVYYLIGSLLVSLAFVIGQQPLEFWRLIRISQGRLTQIQYNAFLDSGDFTLIGLSSTVGLVFLLTAFVAALIALAIVVRRLHGRKFLSLIRSGSVQWHKAVFAAWIWFLLTAASEGVAWMIAPESYTFTFSWSTWLPLFIVSITILPLQTSLEELFVRSYLLQRLGVGVGRAWPAILLTALVFASMHWFNPEVREFGRGVMMTYYISVAVFLGAITIMDDGLEFALGIHAATNIYGAGFVSYQGSALQMDAMFHVRDTNALLMTVLFLASAVLFVVAIHFRYGRLEWKRLWQIISCDERPTTPAVNLPEA